MRFQIDEFFAFKTVEFAFKTMDFALKMAILYEGFGTDDDALTDVL